jgi:hypothetical protein
MLNKGRRFISKLNDTANLAQKVYKKQLDARNGNDAKSPKVLSAKILIELNKKKETIQSFEEVEFQVFSQWGDDGIIQYLIDKIGIRQKTFVEFGVENYTESNTRFLLVNNNWTGLVLDGSEENVDYIKGDILSWGYELYARQSFITRENINKELTDLPFGSELGILSIDIDGNDYYIWKEITTVNPVMVIAEYNSVFGFQQPWTIPYKADFVREQNNRNPLHVFYGSSLPSLCDLAEEKGYSFVGCNSSGNNAYFIRKDRIGGLRALTAEQGFVKSKFRESYNTAGERETSDRLKGHLHGKDVFNTRTGSIEKFK